MIVYCSEYQAVAYHSYYLFQVLFGESLKLTYICSPVK